MERNYQFRERLLVVHEKNICTDKEPVWGFNDSCVFSDEWKIIYPADSDKTMKYAAEDLREFFNESCCIFPNCIAKKSIDTNPDKCIYLVIEGAEDENKRNEYTVTVTESKVVIKAPTSRGIAQGVYYLEDEMRKNRYPAVKSTEFNRHSVFTPRLTHSGFGLDMFPDNHLKAIAHLGIDAIMVFVKAVDKTPHGYVDFNDLIYRASTYGLDVYAYSYIISNRHPDDEDAYEHYESTYGKLFASCPGLKGVIFVGESCEFPSKDERTVPLHYYEVTPENNPKHLPTPGWFPCYDYPQWLELIKKIVRNHNEKADIILWTYNWGYQPEDLRIKLIENMPADIGLMATFEMFEDIPADNGAVVRCVDYTLAFEGPGKYFLSEAKAAKKFGLKLHSQSNTGGLAWDIGTIPYIPAPYIWIKRYKNIVECNKEYGLQGLMECHHYGIWPKSIIARLEKLCLTSPEKTPEKHLEELVIADFGKEYAENVLEAFKCFSEGHSRYIPTNQDQYGPFRVGPSYPLLYKTKTVFDSPEYAHFGNNRICNPMYSYDLKNRRLNFENELENLTVMEEKYDEGCEILEGIIDKLSGNDKENCRYLLGLGRFITNAVRTTLNTKKWYEAKIKLLELIQASPCKASYEEAEIQIKLMKEIAEREIKNAESTIEYVRFDSRLGFEPSMEYMCDEAHILRKIEHTRDALKEAVAEFESTFKEYIGNTEKE
ncbi:MAG: hypothetical protein E7665_02610 [Ruminococcaceae bacterium]|nr:hypothetical protein [Oscillospiraceae bacterium]